MPANANTQQYRQGGRNNVRNSDRDPANSNLNNNGANYHNRQNGGYQQKHRHFNANKGNNDYWSRQNGPQKDNSAKRNDENAGPSNIQNSEKPSTKAPYQRNDRYQARTPSASAPVNPNSQRGERGPLPDWDAVGKYKLNNKNVIFRRSSGE